LKKGAVWGKRGTSLLSGQRGKRKKEEKKAPHSKGGGEGKGRRKRGERKGQLPFKDFLNCLGGERGKGKKKKNNNGEERKYRVQRKRNPSYLAKEGRGKEAEVTRIGNSPDIQSGEKKKSFPIIEGKEKKGAVEKGEGSIRAV